VKRSHLRALAILNDETEIPSEWLTIEPKWRDPRYISKAAQADAGMKQVTAVPWLVEDAPDVALELIGMDEQQVTRALAGHRRARGSSVLDRLRSAADGGQPAQ
jgi:hypothetical protein